MNLILSTVGDKSCHKTWIGGNYDLIVIYYGDDDDKYEEYCHESKMCIRQKGQKFPLIAEFIDKNEELIKSYKYVWLPDDDVKLDYIDIEKMFEIATEHELLLCQPAVKSIDGTVSHEITRRHAGKMRFTNFVEVMAPVFSVDALMTVYRDFYLSSSGWGLDITWSHLLCNPIDKIAILDSIVMLHTRPVGTDYSRFVIHPMQEMHSLLAKYKIYHTHINYKTIYE